MFNLSKKTVVKLLNEFVYQHRQNAQRFFGSTSTLLKSAQNFINEHNTSDGDVPYGVMGQPTCHTHPHMVKPGELVPGLTANEFKNRRQELMKRLIQSVPKDSRSNGHTVIVPSASKQYMSDKIPFIFRQNSDFYYLTGCQEPDSVLIMTSLPGSETLHKTVLLIRGKDEHSELWDGPRTSIDDATQMFRIDVALPYTELVPYLSKYLSDHKSDQLWYSPSSPTHFEVDSSIKTILKNANSNPPYCPRRILATQRLIKSSAEAHLMLESCKVGSAAVNNAMSCTTPGISEHDIHTSIDYWCRRSGAEHLAFPPVVGGGPRATAIHYIHDNQILSEGELVLVDSGCQRYYYNSDITRTWPVSGKFTKPQAILYDIIHRVQSALFEVIKDQTVTLDMLFDAMCHYLGTYLREEGIIPKSTSDSEITTLAFNLCPHHVSHYLGMDVHDTPQVSRSIRIRPGMVITIEPGIYIHPKNNTVPEEFRGIGVRIEDDVLITNGEPLVLTETCMKDRLDIEAIVGTKSLP